MIDNHQRLPEWDLPNLPILRARLTLRLLEPAVLPKFKGAMLRGGFGYAFHRASCPQGCQDHSVTDGGAALCPYRYVFETPHPPGIEHLHNLRDVPRPFVIEPPLDGRTHYAAGDTLEFRLVLIGRGIDYLPYFLFGFEQLGKMGLGRNSARARLERVEALYPWQAVGSVIYQDGRVLANSTSLPVVEVSSVNRQVASLPADLHLVLRTPLRVKNKGEWLRTIDPEAIVRAICWRLDALAIFHGTGRSDMNRWALLEQAAAVKVVREQVQWVDWTRTSTRGSEPHKMTLGGIIGSAVLRNAPPAVRSILVAGSLVHAGKACVFGHGGYHIAPA